MYHGTQNTTLHFLNLLISAFRDTSLIIGAVRRANSSNKPYPRFSHLSLRMRRRYASTRFITERKINQKSSALPFSLRMTKALTAPRLCLHWPEKCCIISQKNVDTICHWPILQNPMAKKNDSREREHHSIELLWQERRVSKIYEKIIFFSFVTVIERGNLFRGPFSIYHLLGEKKSIRATCFLLRGFAKVIAPRL